jgi:hypothetical protein
VIGKEGEEIVYNILISGWWLVAWPTKRLINGGGWMLYAVELRQSTS